MHELLALMATLRDPERGCPWDREQTFATIVPHTLEEAYEVADAIERGDMSALKDELGDLLFQVVFYARMAEEAGHFDFDDIVSAIADKLIRRHPHVFGEARIASAAAQTQAWEAHKARERAAQGGTSVLDGVTVALPALSRAAKLQRRAARVGFDWARIEDILDKVEEETEEVRAEIVTGGARERLVHEVGDLLFAASNIARYADIDPEAALRQANARFESRFRRIEHWLAESGRTPEQSNLEEMETLWRRAKEEEKSPPGV